MINCNENSTVYSEIKLELEYIFKTLLEKGLLNQTEYTQALKKIKERDCS